MSPVAPPAGKIGRHRRAQDVGDLGDIDAAPAGVVTGTAAADLVSRPHHLGVGGDVERRVHRQCDDRRLVRRALCRGNHR